LSAEDVDPGLSDLTPFSVAGVKFNPMPASSPILPPGSNLQVMYQIWASPKDPREYSGQKLEIEYALGKPAAPGNVTRVKDELSMEQFDASGDIVSGKKLSLERQTPGNYLLALTVNKPGSNERTFASASFRILDSDSTAQPSDVLEPGISQDAETGILDQQRGLCHLALGQGNEARVWFRRSLQLNHTNDTARAQLVEAYFSHKDYSAVASLYNDAGITDSTDSATIVHIAASLKEIGNISTAITMLERALHARPEDGPLYLTLSGYYGETGNEERATELARKGKSYLKPAASSPND
jgi:tetratricopeptide (TPR) repeat protein